MQQPCLLTVGDWNLTRLWIIHYSQFLRHPLRQSPVVGTESPCKMKIYLADFALNCGRRINIFLCPFNRVPPRSACCIWMTVYWCTLNITVKMYHPPSTQIPSSGTTWWWGLHCRILLKVVEWQRLISESYSLGATCIFKRQLAHTGNYLTRSFARLQYRCRQSPQLIDDFSLHSTPALVRMVITLQLQDDADLHTTTCTRVAGDFLETGNKNSRSGVKEDWHGSRTSSSLAAKR